MDASFSIDRLLDLRSQKERRRYIDAQAGLVNSEVAEALKRKADELLRSDLQESLNVSELLMRAGDLAGKPEVRALGLLAKANAASIGQGDYEKSLDLYDEASDIYLAHGEEVMQARSQIGKVGALANLGRHSEARQAGQFARETLRKHKAWRPYADLTMNLAIMNARKGEDVEALDLFDQAGATYKDLGEEGETGWLWVQLNRAYVLRNLGRFSESIESSRTAISGLQEIEQTISAARAQQMLALTHFVMGRYNDTLNLLADVRQTYVADGRKRDAVLVDLFMSECLLEMRRFDDVITKCQEVRKLFSGIGSDHVVGQAIANQAIAFAKLGKYEDALLSLQDAKAIFESEDNVVWAALCDLRAAVVLEGKGDFEVSLRLSQQSADVLLDREMVVEAARAQVVAAQAALRLGSFELSRSVSEAARSQIEALSIPGLEYPSQHVQGRISEAEGNLRDALAKYSKASDSLESMGGRMMIEYRPSFLEDKSAVYEDAVHVCLQLGKAEAALAFAERAKSRSLLEILGSRLDLSLEARSPEDQPLVDELMELRIRRDRLYRHSLADEDARERGFSPLGSESLEQHKEIAPLEQRITNLWHTLLVRNADYAQDSLNWTVHSESVQPLLGRDTLLVEYFGIRNELVAFSVSSDRVKPVSLGPVEERVQHLLQLLRLNFELEAQSGRESPPTSIPNAQALLRELHELLVEPVTQSFDQIDRLFVVPHRNLHYLPFHALHDGEKYLIERVEIGYLPSSSILQFCVQEREGAHGALVAAASNDGRLPHTVIEAEAIAGILGGQLLLEDSVTSRALTDDVNEKAIVHLATHGDFRSDNPLFSGLAIADGMLSTLDIFNLQLSASLVTLSACNTGRSVIGGGDELLGLTRAFLSAGAQTLVLSQWMVNDRSTMELMTEFYRNLNEGMSKGSALRGAQVKFATGTELSAGTPTDRYQHPYYWAAFYLVGDIGELPIGYRISNGGGNHE